MSAAAMLPPAVAVSVAVALALGDSVRADDECGPAQPGVEVRCTPSDYDAATGGNIFYRPGRPGGDFSLRLGDGLSVVYDRHAPDDVLQLGDFDSGTVYRYGAVVAVPEDADHAGGVSVSSSEDVTATGSAARGYLKWTST